VNVSSIPQFEGHESFPGEIKSSPFLAEIVQNGIKTSFYSGAVYRHKGIVPLLDTQGDHFEIGLQYGVLLQPEILSALAAYQRIFHWTAGLMGLPVESLYDQLRQFAHQMITKVPARLHVEAEGISQGSGVPLDSILMVTFMYDFLMAGGCTSVLMRAENGKIIHARNNDTSGFGGAELGRLTTVVRRRAEGFHTTVQLDYPLCLGIESGYNDQGLAFTEETLRLREAKPDNYSLNILVRMILEECSELEDIPPYLDRYPVVAGYGEIWSNQRLGKGWLVEHTHSGWTRRALEGDILWDFNTIYSPELKALEVPEKSLRSDEDREAVARAFPRKETYTVQDGIRFIRASEDSQHDHLRCGTRLGVCNAGTQQAMVFDPNGQGIYLAWGEQYCSRAAFYHIHEDFSVPPDLAAAPIPLPTEALAQVTASFQLTSPEQKLPAFVELARQNPHDADFQFRAAYQAFQLKKTDLFILFAENAFSLDPSNIEYRLYAGLAAFQSDRQDDAVMRLNGINAADIFPLENIYRLTALKQLSPLFAENYQAAIDTILSANQVEDIYQKKIVPLLIPRRE
jgi:hypothetical protein